MFSIARVTVPNEIKIPLQSMTEAEWLVSADWRPMWLTVRDRLPARKARLLGVAYCGLLRQEAFFKSYVAFEPWAEQVADGLISANEALAAVAARTPYPGEGELGFRYLVDEDPELRRSITRLLAFFCSPNANRRCPDLLRRVAGDLFHPATLDASWLTPTITAFARQVYDSRDFSLMPFLADALQDAGSDSPGLLAHYRGEGAHVRGCWVIDLLLGKA
jgi:hypothetical protein